MSLFICEECEKQQDTKVTTKFLALPPGMQVGFRKVVCGFCMDKRSTEVITAAEETLPNVRTGVKRPNKRNTKRNKTNG